MSKTRSANLCAYTFSDGRRCRMPRQSGHPFLCCFHARKEAQAQAAEETGRDIRFFLSGDYLSAGDLSLALGRVFAAAANGQLKPKTAGTLAYLGQTLLQTIQLAQHEYINAFGTDEWRDVISFHVEQNGNYLAPPPAPVPASAPAAPPLPAQTPQQLPTQAPNQNTAPKQAQNHPQNQAQNQARKPQPPGPGQPHASIEAGLEPGVSDHANPSAKPNLTRPDPEPGVPHCGSPSAGRNSSQAGRELVVSNHAAVPTARSSSPKEPDPAPLSVTVSPSAQNPDPPAVAGPLPARSRLPRSAAEFAATILASAPSSLPHVAQKAPPGSAGFTPASSLEAAASPSNTRQSGVASSASPTSTPKPAAAPPTGLSGQPVLPAVPPRSPAPRSARPSDSSPSQTSKPCTAPLTNNSSSPSTSSPQPTQPSDLPGFGAPANWEVLIPQTRDPVRRRRPACRSRQIRPWYLPE